MFNQIQRCFKGLDNKNSLISIKIHHMFRNWFGIQTWKKLLENQNFNYGIQEKFKKQLIILGYSTNIYPRE